MTGPVCLFLNLCSFFFLLIKKLLKKARLWSLESHTNVVAYKGHNYPVWSCEFSPFSFYFATGSGDRTARLWSCDHIYPLRVFAGHLSDVDVLPPAHQFLFFFINLMLFFFRLSNSTPTPTMLPQAHLTERCGFGMCKRGRLRAFSQVTRRPSTLSHSALTESTLPRPVKTSPSLSGTLPRAKRSRNSRATSKKKFF